MWLTSFFNLHQVYGLYLENGQMVLRRILANFRATQRFRDFEVHTMLQPLDISEP